MSIERTKYITFGLPAEGVAEARPRLERVEADVMGNLHRLGVQSEPLAGRDRLALLHSQMHPGNREPFRFAWKDIPKHGLGTKDYIAPDSFDFRDSRTFRVGRYWGAASYLQILASELSDKLLAEILELDAELTVTMHIQTVDQLKAIKTIKGKISDIGRMKAEEQKKAVRAGYDMEILPPDLITFSKDAAELLADLQSRNERMFLLTFTVVNMAPNRQRLENDVFTVGGIAQKYNCALKRLDWQQEQAFVSSLALGYNGLEIQRGMTTSSTAIFIPFMTRELRMGGQALYYGIKNTRLEVGVLFAIQQQVHLAVTYSELVSRINAAPLKKSKSNRLEDMIAVKEKELSKIMRYKQALYQDWKDGEITHNDYRHMSEDYEQQAESINTVLRTLREERDQLENGMAAESPFLTAFLKYQNIDKLTRDILIELIDHIKVYEGGNISVKFKYADEFRRMAEYIELNSQLAVG